MRESQITLDGKTYPVRGLTVLQCLELDAQTGNVDISVIRVRRVANALRNGKAFLPDPDNPNGQIQSADISVAKVEEILSQLIVDMFEWYKVEDTVMDLNGIGSKSGAAKGTGESQAAE